MAKKKERRDNKTYASDSLKEGLEKVFNTFNSNDAIKVIAENLLSTVSNSSDKNISEMTVEELISEKQRLQNELSSIDSEILQRLNPTKEKESKKTKEKKETNKTESDTEQTESDSKEVDKEEEKK